MTPDEMYGQVRAQVQCYCGGDSVHGHLWDPPVCPSPPAQEVQEVRHGITTYWTTFGWTWGCRCGAEGRGNAAPTQAAAFSYGEKHIRHALRKS